MLEARRKLAGSRITLENHQRRIAALEAYSRWHAVRERIDGESPRDRRSTGRALELARQRAAEQATVVKTREDEAKAADAAARRRRQGPRGCRIRGRAPSEGQASVDAALAATQAAQKLLPGDAALSEAAQKLEAKSDGLKSGLLGPEWPG